MKNLQLGGELQVFVWRQRELFVLVWIGVSLEQFIL